MSSPPLKVCLPPEMAQELRQYCATHKLKYSTVIVDALYDFFSSHPHLEQEEDEWVTRFTQVRQNPNTPENQKWLITQRYWYTENRMSQKHKKIFESYPHFLVYPHTIRQYLRLTTILSPTYTPTDEDRLYLTNLEKQRLPETIRTLCEKAKKHITYLSLQSFLTMCLSTPPGELTPPQKRRLTIETKKLPPEHPLYPQLQQAHLHHHPKNSN